ncbi:uncharacterized protein LOC116291406 [Actinia tenebrosa]|uniref:Uncharacterized protein LOC116291406 n=1 Tax=Actinia tenebrosa TaxID=6105 RepID=A0A6P8HF98_ACTTE|nr:uncharacterized protein LOC116291406 [Actinia tenebrosa]XP_031554436.1 uncharacterized protein LOC116291406 [Actinia tenebrosa]
MAAIQGKESTAYKQQHEECLEDRVEAMAPKYHQNFFTTFDDDDDDEDQFMSQLISTGKDPHNHNIEVELGRDEERPKRPNMTERTGRGDPGMKPVHPLPFIKIDLNNNYRNWETIFGGLKEANVCDVDWSLKTHEPVHDDPGFLPPDLPSSKAGTTSITVFGADINDIPTSYDVPGLGVHELAVVGTFVHGMIIPGFPYRVRLNGSNEYLFEGNALVLEAIGQGYGKRLTFECDDLLNNKNFFWSDNNPPSGYALSIKLPMIEGKYTVKNKDEKSIGSFTVKAVDDHQIIQSVRCLQDGIQIEVRVKMLCYSTSFPNMDTSEGILGGVAIATRKRRNIQVERIKNVHIAGIKDCCQLIKSND